MITTIKLNKNTKYKLDQYREYKNESYDELINKLIYIINQTKTSPNLSQQTLKEIEAARNRIKNGNFLTEDEAKKRLGF
ncbi:MAG: hypothetical protein PHT94_00090 [Candidatus Nanoarchaeia archaeon]|nr:hypothetical protein [Candidatus Nanoarchaeia archaeon]